MEAFEVAHEARYGYRMSRTIELVTLRVRGIGHTPSPPRRTHPERGPETPQTRALLGQGPAYFEGAWHEAAHYDREKLGAGDRIKGPAIIAEYSATTVLPPGWKLEVLTSGALVLTPSGARPATSPRG